MVSTRDFYGVLEVPRSATGTQVNGAFKKLALKWHPAKDGGSKEKFEEIGEAYTILSDQKLKAMYDQYGEDGLQNWSYPENGEEIFEKFFGTKNPFANFNFGSDEVQFAPRMQKPGPKKMENIVLPLECSLEELFNGCRKTYQVTRKRAVVVSEKTSYVDEAKTLALQVEPGWTKGTKITFPSEGDAGPGIVPADIVFELQELAHPHFSRDQSNLIFTADVDLTQALTGTIINIATLDGRVLSISCPEVVAPGYVKVVKGEGMPLVAAGGGGARGDLLIRFRIAFPKYLNEYQKSTISKVLSGGKV